MLRGQLPSKPEGARKTSLLISWLPADSSLLEALRPFKARSRGRRLKELAILGAEMEKIGFRLVVGSTGYQVMAPTSQLALLRASAGDRASSLAEPAAVEAAEVACSPAANQEPDAAEMPLAAALEVSAPEVEPLDEDAISFAESFG